MDANNYVVIQGWMRTELRLKGNELLVFAIIYGFSQTEEQRFTGSLQYLADWCGATKQGIQNSLKSLLDKQFIEKQAIIKNGVKFCEYTTNLHTYETKLHTGIQLSCINNIEDKKEDKKVFLSKDKNTTKNFTFGANQKSKTTLWDKCVNLIDDFTNDSELRELLIKSLRMFLDNSKESGTLFYTNTFKGKLNTLRRLADDHEYFDIKAAMQMVQQTLDNGWNNFYGVYDKKPSIKNTHDRLGESGSLYVKHHKLTEEEKRNGEKF